MTRIYRLGLSWDAMNPEEKINEIATKTRLLSAAEQGDIETIGSIDVSKYFGAAVIFDDVVSKIVDSKEHYLSVSESASANAEDLRVAAMEYEQAVTLFKEMFKPHYTLLAEQKAEIESASEGVPHV